MSYHKYIPAMLKKSNTHRKGFTIIEILVGMVVMAVLFGAGSVSYRDYVRRESVNNAASEVRTVLYKVRQLAQDGVKPDSGLTNASHCYGTGKTLNRYILSLYRINLQELRYSIIAECTGYLVTVQNTQSIKLPLGSSFSIPPSQYIFAYFDVVTGEVTMYPTTATTIRVQGPGVDENVWINALGEIK